MGILGNNILLDIEFILLNAINSTLICSITSIIKILFSGKK